MSGPSIGYVSLPTLPTHVVQSVVTLEAFPKRFDAARVPEGETTFFQIFTNKELPAYNIMFP